MPWIMTSTAVELFGLRYVAYAEGRDSSAAVEHSPHDREVVGLNPCSQWGFLLLLSFPL